MKEPVLSLQGICKSFSGVRVLNDVDLDLVAGEVHCVVGENGAGKSTLIKIISGAYQADAGTYRLAGKDAFRKSPRWMIENGIETIYQEIDIVPELSVAENISLGHENLTRLGNIDVGKMSGIAESVLREIGADDIDVNQPISNLKVAHQQMVAIARSLAQNGKVLILDEPTAVFTAREVEMLFGVIKGLQKKGLAIVYISHHLDEIFEIGDRVTVLKDGTITTSGTIGNYKHNDIVSYMVGREIDLSHWDESEIGEVRLQVDGLGHIGEYEDISFSVRAGEIVGIGGLVGSGRSEVARGIMGIDPVDTGEIRIRSEITKIRSPGEALKMGLGLLPENRKEEGLVLGRPVLENALYSSIVKSSRYGFVPWKKLRKKSRDSIDSLSTRYPHPEVEIRFLSGGNQQKVVFAKLLGAECDILILDEPTRGVDVGARTEIYKDMQRLKKEGKAILMISSDLSELLSQSDRILVMSKGSIIGEIPRSEATEEKVLTLALNVSEALV